MKKILINWYYDRYDLTKYLFEISKEAEIIFIAKHSPPRENEQNNFTGSNISIIYWSDYKSPYQLLNQIRPDLVVFHDIEAFNQIALNIAAKNNGITTCVLQHGLRGGYEVGDALNHASTNGIFELSSTSWWTLSFLLRSLKWKNFRYIFPLLKFIVARKRNELTVALYKNQFELRLADVYLEFSKANATYHQVRDGVKEDRFRLIGNPGFDDFFQKIKNISANDAKDPYALLIDSPFCEANFVQKKRMTAVEKNDYIKRLNEYCILKNLRLFIKRHPLSYSSSGLFKDENIEYFKDADIAELVGRSQLVFLLHFSTLAPLCMYYKPFFFFHNKYIEQTKAITSLSIPVYDLLNFKSEQLAMEKPHCPLSLEVLQDYLFIPDGKSTERLKQLLLTDALNEVV